MTEPAEFLGTAAQVAITLAGFAGVVVVFGSAAVHEWSPVDKFRLRLMLLSASLALMQSMVGMLLVSTGLPAALVWRLGSGCVAAVLLPALIGGVATFTRFRPQELARTGASRAIFYTSTGGGFLLVVTQIGNAAIFAEFWLFLLAIVVSILIALLQFVRLILARRAPV